MANRTIYEIIAKAVGFGKTKKEVKGLSNTLTTFVGGLATVTAAYKAFGFAIDSVSAAGKLEGVSAGFDNLSKQAGFSSNAFKKFDNALDGTVSKLDVMKQANNAMLLGIVDSEEQMSEMFDIAQRLAKGLGQDATFGIESMITGLGRQSKLMLDNLGIMVDVNKANENYAETLGKQAKNLTDSERKQAFINEALRQGKNLVKGMGDEVLTTADKINKMTATFDNLQATFGEAVVETGIVDYFSDLADQSAFIINSFLKQDETLNDSTEQYVRFGKEIEDTQLKINELVSEQINSSDTNVKTAEEAKAIADAYERQKDKIKGLREELRQLKQDDEMFVEVQEALQNAIPVTAEAMTASTSTFDEYMQGLKKVNKETEDYENLTMRQAKATLRLKDAKLGQIYADAAKDIGVAFGASDELISGLTIAQAIADTYAGANKALAQGGIFGTASAVGIVAAGLANVAQIRNAYRQKQKQKQQHGQYGFEGVVDEPTQFTVGEGGAAEYVSVQPMEGVNNAGGGGININISGNVMSEQFVEEELAERISEAVRKGVDFGMS